MALSKKHKVIGYIVYWQNKKIPDVFGHGKMIEKEFAHKAAEMGNTSNPSTYHWVEPVFSDLR